MKSMKSSENEDLSYFQNYRFGQGVDALTPIQKNKKLKDSKVKKMEVVSETIVIDTNMETKIKEIIVTSEDLVQVSNGHEKEAVHNGDSKKNGHHDGESTPALRRSSRKVKPVEKDIYIDIFESEPDEIEENVKDSKKSEAKAEVRKSVEKDKNLKDQVSQNLIEVKNTESPKDFAYKPATPESVRKLKDDGKVGGRRPIRGFNTPQAVKRKGASTYDTPEEKRLRNTPSVSSPGWRYLPSPSWIWSGRKSQLQNDSMTVNVDETINNRELDDSQLINDLKEEPKPSWRCNIM